MALVTGYADVDAEARRRARKERIFARINTAETYLNILGPDGWRRWRVLPLATTSRRSSRNCGKACWYR